MDATELAAAVRTAQEKMHSWDDVCRDACHPLCVSMVWALEDYEEGEPHAVEDMETVLRQHAAWVAEWKRQANERRLYVARVAP
jgi:hypothetical protein